MKFLILRYRSLFKIKENVSEKTIVIHLITFIVLIFVTGYLLGISITTL